MCRLEFQKDLDYNHLMIHGISQDDIRQLLSKPKPEGSKLASVVCRSEKEKDRYDCLLSDELIDYDYASSYLDVDKAWELLKKLSVIGDNEDIEDNQDRDESVTEAANEQVYDYRHIKDMSNVIKYDTLAEPLNKKILGYIRNSDLGCEVECGTMFPCAPAHAMPVNFLLRKGDRQVAVLLVHLSKVKRYSVQETEALCRENGVEVRRFYFECDNEKEYVIERIRKAFE